MEHQKSIWLLLWGVFSVLFFFINLTTGIGGVVLTYYSEVSYLVPYYIQCGTTATSFALAVCETGLLICALHWRAKLREKTLQQSANNIELRSVATPTSELEDMTQEGGKERYLTVYQSVQLFFSLLGCNVGLLLTFWSLTVVYNYKNTAWIEGKLWPFIVVDIILGIVVPSVIIGSVLIIMSIIREVTSGNIETRKLLPFIFDCLSYEKGNKESYWVMLNSFYYKIATKGLCYSSWAIYSMFIFTFFIPWCFFINGVVTTRYGIPGCSHLTDQTKPTSYCFVLNLGGYSNVYVNCTVNTSYSNQLFCFEFKRIGQDISPITYIIVSIMMYYILITCISIIFRVTKELMSFASKKSWSGLIMSFGVFVFVIGVAIYGTSIYVYMNLNILTGFQIVALCIDIILVGVVVLQGEPLAQNMPIATTCRRSSTDTLLSGTTSASNSDAPSQPNGYTRHHLTQHHNGQTYHISHQRSHNPYNGQDMRRGRNHRHHNHRPFSRPTQQAIAERRHIFEHLNRPTDKPPTPPPPQSLVNDSPASSSRTLPVAPSLTISRSSTPHSGASGAQPSPVLPMQNASLWPVSETSLDERQQSSLRTQDKKEHKQPQPQQKQEIQLQLREPHIEPSEALNRLEEAIRETTPGAPLPPNGTAAYSITLETAVPTRPPARPRASSNIGNEEGRYNILIPRSPSPTSTNSNTSTLERGYGKATAL